MHKDLTCLTENYRPIKFLTSNEEDSQVFVYSRLNIPNSMSYLKPLHMKPLKKHTTAYLKPKRIKRTNEVEVLIGSKIL